MTSPARAYQPPSVRTAAEIREKITQYSGPEYARSSGGPNWVRGVLESLRWALGERPDSPVTGKILDRPPTVREISREASDAEEGMRGFTAEGRQWHHQHGLMYLTGCENSLFWAAGGEGI